MTAPRYLLCPGWVTSQTDGQSHYIGAHQLARLYGVRRASMDLTRKLADLRAGR